MTGLDEVGFKCRRQTIAAQSLARILDLGKFCLHLLIGRNPFDRWTKMLCEEVLRHSSPKTSHCLNGAAFHFVIQFCQQRNNWHFQLFSQLIKKRFALNVSQHRSFTALTLKMFKRNQSRNLAVCERYTRCGSIERKLHIAFHHFDRQVEFGANTDQTRLHLQCRQRIQPRSQSNFFSAHHSSPLAQQYDEPRFVVLRMNSIGTETTYFVLNRSDGSRVFHPNRKVLRALVDVFHHHRVRLLALHRSDQNSRKVEASRLVLT